MLFNLLFASFYVFIGGSSVGKTTTLQVMKERGFPVIEEMASQVIVEDFANGVKDPWMQDNFQSRLIVRQLQLEEQLKDQSVVFVDRGIFDPFAYMKLRNQEMTVAYQQVEEALAGVDLQRYAKAFFFHPWENFVYQEYLTRRENAEESDRIAEIIRDVYQGYVSEIVEVPAAMTPEERADFIIGVIRQSS